MNITNNIWRYKYKIFTILCILFVACSISLINGKIYFDSERIIEELNINSIDVKLINDNNLIFYGLSFDKSLDYDDFKKINQYHFELKQSNYVNKVFSIINEKKIISSSFLPIPEYTLNLDSKKEYLKSINKLQKSPSNFINKSRKEIFFLIESKEELTIKENQELITYLNDNKVISSHKESSIAGRVPSELYFQRKVIKEFIIITTISAILCFFFLYFMTKNIKLVLLSISCVIMSIVITLGISQVIFGGIELVMIITPAILFIVCISDIMHLTNNQSAHTNNQLFFQSRMKYIGKAVALTSFTTAISFLTFLTNEILPIIRFGIITSIGIICTLIIATIVYAISIDKKFNHINTPKAFKQIVDYIINLCLKHKSIYFHIAITAAIIIGIYGSINTKVDNYLTDEINVKSEIYQETLYFDENFGGIKPITIIVENTKISSQYISQFKEDLKKNNFTIDFSNDNIDSKLLDKYLINSDEMLNKTFFSCRTMDIGSQKTQSIINKLEEKYNNKLSITYSGAGYLFDITSNKLTKQLIYSLIIAIFSIGLIFFFLNNFNINYFIIAIIPNIVPIVICLGILFFFDFYFSLSNAFIFTIVFGLIIDDSIHIISAYSNYRKNNINKEKALENTTRHTGSAVIKTTIIVIICLAPLMFSEFKSVSQLSYITIISAITAVIFDLIYLPIIMKRLGK